MPEYVNPEVFGHNHSKGKLKDQNRLQDPGGAAEEEECCHHFACNTCPSVHTNTSKVTNRKYPKLKEVDDMLGGAAAWEKVDSTAEPCPKCEHPRVYFMQLQNRSADQLMTTVYK